MYVKKNSYKPSKDQGKPCRFRRDPNTHIDILLLLYKDFMHRFKNQSLLLNVKLMCLMYEI